MIGYGDRGASASTRRDKLASHFLALIQFAAVIGMAVEGVSNTA
jgi:hypothetical protein